MEKMEKTKMEKMEKTKMEKMEKTKMEKMEKISITSDAFKDGDTIPDEYTCWGKDISPSLLWTGVSKDAKSIALVMDDPDAAKGPWVHWILFNIPATTNTLSKAIPKYGTLVDGSRQGRTDFNEIGYGGPCPPPGKPHRYYFRIYALDIMLNLLPGVSRKQVDESMEGHILVQGDFMGRYGR